MQLLTKRKTLESHTDVSKEDKHPVASLKKNIAPRANFSLAKNTQKQNYVLVTASKPTQAPEYPWTQVVYQSQKPPATKLNIKTKD